jgi:hypothetical protein
VNEGEKASVRKEGGEKKGSVCEEECESESNPKPRPKPNPSSADVAERGIVSIGVCVYYCRTEYKDVCVGRGGYWGTCATTRDDEQRTVWTSLPITR